MRHDAVISVGAETTDDFAYLGTIDAWARKKVTACVTDIARQLVIFDGLLSTALGRYTVTCCTDGSASCMAHLALLKSEMYIIRCQTHVVNSTVESLVCITR